MDIKKLTHLAYRFYAKPSGLEPTPFDPRDFQTGLFRWGAYTPKNKVKLIPTVSVKDQNGFNTCQWNATATQKEKDETMELLTRSIVAKGKEMGLVSGDGFSNLRSGQQVLKDWGIVEASQAPEDIADWNDYVNFDIGRFTANANLHKTSSYWFVSSRNDILKLLDQDRILTTGIDWYTAFNQGGGFEYPWIISKAEGYKIGGHAITMIGYDLNYQGQKVYIFQNSYGALWGDNGKFYITMDYFDRNNYGVLTNLDLPSDMGKFLTLYDGKNVKGSASAVYFIQAGKKKPYPDEVTYVAFNTQDSNILSYSLVKDEELAKVPTGDNMQIEKSLYWDFLKDLKSNEDRIKRLIEILYQKD